MKIKLVAIAKDEAAYLSEWIFHHLFFGFDEIDIYINYTSDDSEKIIKEIGKKHPVNLKYAEDLFKINHFHNDRFLSKPFLDYNKLQARAYADALGKTLDDKEFSHIMFLDIDEFWTPACFEKSIKEVLLDLSMYEVVSFYWRNKVLEQTPFLMPFQQKVFYLGNPHYKTIIQMKPDILIMNTHRSLHKSGIEVAGVRYNENTLPKTKDEAFILHRFQRSEMEYISMLGRGDPTDPEGFALKFTREGFVQPENPDCMFLPLELLKIYNAKYSQFVSQNNLGVLIEAGKEFVIKRKLFVENYIEEHLDACKIIKKVIPGTYLDEN